MVSEDVVYHSKIRLVLMTLGSLMFVILGYWFVSDGVGAVVAVGWLSIVFFGCCGIFAVWRLVRPTPAVIVSAQGIVDHATANAAGLVPWTEIREVKILSYMNRPHLGIFVRDPATFIAQASPLKRATMHTNLRLTGAPVVIPRVALATNLESLESLILARWAAETRLLG